MTPSKKTTLARFIIITLFIVGTLSTVFYFATDELSKVINAENRARADVSQIEKGTQNTLQALKIIKERLAGNVSIMVGIFLNREALLRNAAYAELDKNNTVISSAQKGLMSVARNDKNLALLSKTTKLIEKFRDDLQETVEGIELGDIELAHRKFIEYSQQNMLALTSQISDSETQWLAEVKALKDTEANAQAKLWRTEILIVLLSLIVSVTAIIAMLKIMSKFIPNRAKE
jgi:hypothetical protein